MAKHNVKMRFVHIERAKTHIWEISLVAGIRYRIVVLIRFILLILLASDGRFEVNYSLFILSRVEMHHTSIKVEVFLPEYVLFIVTIRFNLLSLSTQAPIVLVFHIKRTADLFLFLHMMPSPSISLIFSPFSAECSNLLNLDPLYIRDYLLMLADVSGSTG
jgi:hypothetical protein